MKTFSISRRSFLHRFSAMAAAGGLPLWYVQSQAQTAVAQRRPGPNDRPRIALIGCGGMGRGDAQNASRFGDVVAVCDVDKSHAAAAAKQFSREGNTPEMFHDFRRMLERAKIDVVIQATPDHWHTLANMAAVKAGKDVYGEKPLTLTIDEGKRLVRAVRDEGAVFQTGSQQRSDGRFRLACELVRNGRIGQLREIEVWLPAGLRGGPFPSKPVPGELDWEFWLGQSPEVDYVPERCHTTFRFWLDYSGGTMTDWGAHHNDIARWAVGAEAPVRVEGTVLEQPVEGGYTAPSDYEVRYTYANGVVQSVRSTRDVTIYGGVANERGRRHGVKFIGSEGWIWVTRGNLNASQDEIIQTPLTGDAERLYASTDHMANFFEGVRTRKRPICDAEVGHRSASVCHMGVIALRLGRSLKWDPEKEQFIGDGAAEANRFLAREMRKPYDYQFIS